MITRDRFVGEPSTLKECRVCGNTSNSLDFLHPDTDVCEDCYVIECKYGCGEPVKHEGDLCAECSAAELEHQQEGVR